MREIPTMIVCPTCRKLFDPDKQTALPFCSERCRLVDLGRWIDERYSVPAIRDGHEPEEPCTDDP